LSAVVRCCLLLSAAVCCCLLLSAAVCCCLLLSAAVLWFFILMKDEKGKGEVRIDFVLVVDGGEIG
jgi:hypothetical protein